MLTNSAYARLSLGYGFPIAADNLYDIGYYTSSSTNKTLDAISASLGKGLYIDAAIGENVLPNLALELGFSYLAGTSTLATQEDSGLVHNIYLTGNMFRIVPAIVVKAKVENVELYSRFGLVIGIPDFTSQDDVSDGISTVETLKWRFNGGASIGMNAAMGINFPIKKNMDFYTELNLNSMSYAPQKGVMYEATVGGVSVLDKIPLNQKEIDFKKEINTNPIPQNQPDEELTRKFPFSSLGLMIGLKFGF